MIESIPVAMLHEDLESFQDKHFFPDGFTVDRFKAGGSVHWADLQSTTDSFETRDQALSFFEEEFGQHEDLLANDCYFLKNSMDQYIGSAMAWHGETPFDQSYGRLHWVVIRPDVRGMGFGKQLITFILTQLKKRYQKAYLTTQTNSFQAIDIYLNFGFKPWMQKEEDLRAWTMLRPLLSNPVLDTFLK